HLRHQVTGRVLENLVHRPHIHNQITGSSRLTPPKPKTTPARHHREPAISRRAQQRRRLSSTRRRGHERRRNPRDRIISRTVLQRRAGGRESGPDLGNQSSFGIHLRKSPPVPPLR